MVLAAMCLTLDVVVLTQVSCCAMTLGHMHSLHCLCTYYSNNRPDQVPYRIRKAWLMHCSHMNVKSTAKYAAWQQWYLFVFTTAVHTPVAVQEKSMLCS